MPRFLKSSAGCQVIPSQSTSADKAGGAAERSRAESRRARWLSGDALAELAGQLVFPAWPVPLSAPAPSYPVSHLIERIVGMISRPPGSTNRRRGRTRDYRMASRVPAIVPPFSLRRPTLTIRKFSPVPIRAEGHRARARSGAQERTLRLSRHRRTVSAMS